MIDIPVNRMSGRPLRALLAAARKSPFNRMAAAVLRKELGMERLRTNDRSRGEIAFSYAPLQARKSHDRPSQELGVPRYDGWPSGGGRLAAAYREGSVAPGEVVERAIRAAKEFSAREPSVGPILGFDEERAFQAASDAGDRIREGRARGPLDGVPIAIKEEFRVEGLPTRVGTLWMPHTPATEDAVSVARLRAAGAVIIGNTPMTEYGMSPLGDNVHRVMPRNPHNANHLPGGSSSGSGVAVAEGVVPVALAVDGGGSVRIPACLNGVFGLKPTFGRIPASGHGNPGGSSVIHIGPIGATVEDIAHFLEVAAGADATDPASLGQPAIEPGALVRAMGRGVKGLLIGVDEDEWSKAEAEVAKPGREVLTALEKEGAKLVPVQLPDGKDTAAVGYLTIGLEIFTSLRAVRRDHFEELSPGMQLLVSELAVFEPDDYLDAQRVRSEIRAETAKVLSAVDLIALPTTRTPAPPINDEEAKNGFVDLPALASMCRYAFLGNLTGIPFGTAPVGTDANHLPVGVQFGADAWDEGCVLQAMAHLERMGLARAIRPAPHVDLLRR